MRPNNKQMQRKTKPQLKNEVRILLFFIFGIVIGVFGALVVREQEKGELIKYINSGLGNLREVDFDKHSYLMDSLYRNIKIILAIWVAGLFAYGYIFVFGLTFVKGALYGFTEAFLTIEYGTKGVFLGIIGYAPHNIICVPILFYLAKLSIEHSYSNKAQQVKINMNRSMMLEYILILMITIVVMLISVVLETFLTPVLLKEFVTRVFS